MVKFILGEDRHIKFLVHSNKNEHFEITEAAWELLKAGKVEQSGACVVSVENEKNYLDIKLSPRQLGTYYLMLTYTVGDETIKNKEEVWVDQ